jgi:hypothetical protein
MVTFFWVQVLARCIHCHPTVSSTAVVARFISATASRLIATFRNPSVSRDVRCSRRPLRSPELNPLLFYLSSTTKTEVYCTKTNTWKGLWGCKQRAVAEMRTSPISINEPFRFSVHWNFSVQLWEQNGLVYFLRSSYRTLCTEQSCAEIWNFHCGEYVVGLVVCNAVSTLRPQDGDSMYLRNADIYLRVYTASHPRTTSSHLPPSEP